MIRRPTPSPEPIPIPPRHAEPTVRSESFESLRPSSPTSYFTAAEYQSQRSSSVASTSIAGTEGALLEAETVEVAQVGCDDIEVEDYPVNVIPGWAQLQQEIINSIVESIHANPAFFDHLVARFPDQDEIFGTSIEAWRGLHRVCRRVEARQLERLEAELRADEAAEDPGGWEEYICTGGNPLPSPNNHLLHTPLVTNPLIHPSHGRTYVAEGCLVSLGSDWLIVVSRALPLPTFIRRRTLY